MKIITASFAAWLALAGIAVAAPQAQGQSGKTEEKQGQQGGPLVFQQVKSGFVVAPDVKVTDFDGSNRTLIGGYGGWLQDGRFLVGLGAYTLIDDSSDRDLTYGGLVLGYTHPVGRNVQVGARALLGAGEATLTEKFRWDIDLPHIMRGRDMRSFIYPWPPFEQEIPFTQGFLVAEPQADVVVRLSNWLALNAGVGYRFIGESDGWGDRLRGATGSVSVRIGSGF